MNDSIKEALRDVVNNCDKESRVSSQMEISAYIYSIEQQNKALADMVEMLTEKIKRLEEPKICETCKHRNHLANESEPCNSCFRRMGYIGRLFDEYEPRETK